MDQTIITGFLEALLKLGGPWAILAGLAGYVVYQKRDNRKNPNKNRIPEGILTMTKAEELHKEDRESLKETMGEVRNAIVLAVEAQNGIMERIVEGVKDNGKQIGSVLDQVKDVKRDVDDVRRRLNQRD